MTQEQLASASGTGPPAISNIQTGRILWPRRSTVRQLSEPVTGYGPPARQEDAFAKLVRTYRLGLAMTQEQLAAASGVALRTIGNIETGRVPRPRPTTVRLLADALNLHGTQRDQFCQRALSTPLDGKPPAPSPQPTQPGHPNPDTPQQPGRRTPHQRTAPDTRATPATDQPQGPAGQASGPTPEASGPPVPRQLPADLATFIGRRTELDQLDNLAAQAHRTGPAITTIDGMGGIGKTTLAVHWAHQAADRYPDGQLYVNLRGFDPAGRAVPAGEAVRGFLDALGVPAHRIPADLPTQAALYRSLLAGRRMLILLDNAHHADQVRPLLPASPTCLVLITSRNTLTGLIAVEGAHPITLDLLSAGEARQLLAARLGPTRIAAEPRAADAIITGCARLPLALAIAAARAAAHPTFPLTALAAELGQASTVLDTLTCPDNAANLPTVFSCSYHTLSPPAARLFRLLGLHPGPDISTAAAASLAGLAPAEAAPLLAQLAHTNLLTEPAPGRYTLHDLLRAYAADQAHRTDPPTQRRAATHRMLDHYLHTGHAAAHLLNPTRDPIPLTPPRPGTSPQQLTSHAQAMAWFIAEHRVLLAAVDHAAATGLHTHTWQLAWALLTYLNRQAHWHDLVATYRTALAAIQQLADPAIEPRIHRILGHAYTRLGRFHDAHHHLRTSLDLATRAGDPTGQAHTHLTHSAIWERQNRHHQALEHAQQALRLYQAAGHQVGQARALNQIGWCHAHLHDYRQALTACQHALTLHQKLDNVEGQATTWDSLGYIHHHLNHHTQAITCYHNSLHLLRELSDRYREADTLTRLGDTHHTAGNTQAARNAWQHALTILTDLDHPDAERVRGKLQQHSTAECALPTPRAHARHE